MMHLWIAALGVLALIVERYWLHGEPAFWIGLIALCAVLAGLWDEHRRQH